MEDSEVITAFVNEGAHRAFGTSLHIEGEDVLMLDGWWHVALRLDHDAFILRNEEAPRDTTILDDIAKALAARGLAHVATDLPGITVLTMNRASLGYVSWSVWAPDVAAGQAAVATAVTQESFLENSAFYDSSAEPDYSAELGGARRLAGLPPSIVLTVGLGQSIVEPLETAMTDCRFESKAFGEILPDACGALIPTVVVIDAREQQGRDFVMQLRAAACGRYLPVMAVTPDAIPPLGADAAVAAGQDPLSWVAPIRHLLP
jgi:hypothetical protein